MQFEKGATYTVQDCAEFTLTALKNEDFLQHCYHADDLRDFKAKEEAERTAIIFGSYEPKPNGEGNVGICFYIILNSLNILFVFTCTHTSPLPTL